MEADHTSQGLPAPKPVERLRVDPRNLPLEDLLQAEEPIVLEGLIADWPAVHAANTSDQALFEYLMRFDNGAVVPVSVGSADLDGRIFYNDQFTGPNAERSNAHMRQVLENIVRYGNAEKPPLIYVASAGIDECLPKFRTENDLDFGPFTPVASIWIGTRTRIAAHNDLPLNVAACVAGERRFTLFPPEQISNLYIGPFEYTPAGRPISFVDFAKPDLERFPRFTEAMAHARVAMLSPGDALFMPSMWWHHVEALGTFNILLNYWWRTVPSFLGTPQDVLNHAMLTLRDLPTKEKKIWRDMFDYYVFRNDEDVAGHIPTALQGILAPIDEDYARNVRTYLLNRLNR